MEQEKNKNGLVGVLIVIIVLLLCVIGYLLFGNKIMNNKVDNNTTTTVPTTTKSESDNTNVKTISVRTYRFFGYEDSKGPDMYTTLKLYSDNKYEFFVNNCSEIIKYAGSYTETDTSISLSGEANYIFNKKQNGNVLDFTAAKVDVCQESGGDFALESYKLQ